MASHSSSQPHPLLASWALCSRTFVVTGGTKGIGLTTARSLLAHGATVLICARTESEVSDRVKALRNEFPTHGDQQQHRVYGTSCDLSTSEGRSTLVTYTESIFGSKLHGLVNNVGINIRKPLQDQTSDEYHSIINTNVDSVYFLCKEFQSMLSNAENATVVNVASAAGIQSSGTGAAYGMSKAAVIHLTKILACEWARKGIRVNAIAPWMCMTPMLEEAIRKDASQLDKVKEWTPMKRLATVEEVAAPIVFLCMPCSGYVTGQCLGVDGGLSAQAFDGPCVTPS